LATAKKAEAMANAAQGDSRYLALTTYRRDGRPVTTPVWLVDLEGKIYVFTAASTGKAKRVRATGRVRFAPCSMSGRRILGEWREGTGRVVDDEALRERALAALQWAGSCRWRCSSTGCVGSIATGWCWS
jgi:PPOX class probable F420-dependent enzyme